jgi:hypothetical protein
VPQRLSGWGLSLSGHTLCVYAPAERTRSMPGGMRHPGSGGLLPAGRPSAGTAADPGPTAYAGPSTAYTALWGCALT